MSILFSPLPLTPSQRIVPWPAISTRVLGPRSVMVTWVSKSAAEIPSGRRLMRSWPPSGFRVEIADGVATPNPS